MLLAASIAISRHVISLKSQGRLPLSSLLLARRLPSHQPNTHTYSTAHYYCQHRLPYRLSHSAASRDFPRDFALHAPSGHLRTPPTPMPPGTISLASSLARPEPAVQRKSLGSPQLSCLVPTSLAPRRADTVPVSTSSSKQLCPSLNNHMSTKCNNAVYNKQNVT